MVEFINTFAQILIIVLGIVLILICAYNYFRKDKLKYRRTIQITIFIIELLIVTSGIATWQCSVIIENRNTEFVKGLEANIEALTPRLEILEIKPTESQEWRGQLVVKAGNNANQKIDEFSFEIEFESDFDEAKFNYYWDLPSSQGVKYFEPEVIAKNSNKFKYISEDALPPGFIVHFIFTSEQPLVIKSVELSP